jgi:membrane-bound serine protease (ClpP class)
MDELRKVLDGKVIKKKGREFILSLSGPLTERPMPPFKKFLNYLAHPNLVYIFLILGVYGLIYEFTNPGIGLGAAIGGMSLMLAALALQIIPINVIGILLIIFGIALMVFDIWVPSFGILTAGGLVSFFIGSITLIDVQNFSVNISISLIIGATVSLLLFFIFAAGAGLKIQLKKVTTGPEGMIGLKGKVQDKLNPEGTVYLHGEIWQAMSVDGEFKKNIIIEVTEVRGNLLLVKKAEDI